MQEEEIEEEEIEEEDWEEEGEDRGRKDQEEIRGRERKGRPRRKRGREKEEGRKRKGRSGRNKGKREKGKTRKKREKAMSHFLFLFFATNYAWQLKLVSQFYMLIGLQCIHFSHLSVFSSHHSYKFLSFYKCSFFLPSYPQEKSSVFLFLFFFSCGYNVQFIDIVCHIYMAYHLAERKMLLHILGVLLCPEKVLFSYFKHINNYYTDTFSWTQERGNLTPLFIYKF